MTTSPPPQSPLPTSSPPSASSSSPAPQGVIDLAAACVRFVKAALNFELDFERDTLPVLDAYLLGAREAVRERPETLPLVAAAVGAYAGEVVRRYHACWWRSDSADPLGWQIEFRDVFLSFRPVELAQASLLAQIAGPALVEPEEDGELPDGAGSGESAEADEVDLGGEPHEPGLLVDERDRSSVAARLELLPPVTEQEYWAPSTRLEVIDIVVDAIQAQYLLDPDRRRRYEPSDYDD